MSQSAYPKCGACEWKPEPKPEAPKKFTRKHNRPFRGKTSGLCLGCFGFCYCPCCTDEENACRASQCEECMMGAG